MQHLGFLHGPGVGTTMTGMPITKAHIMGHDVPDQPLVEKAAQILDTLIVPGIGAGKKLADERAERFMEPQMLLEGGIAACLHQRLFVGKVRNDVFEQSIKGLVDCPHIKRLDEQEQISMFIVNLWDV